MRRRERILPLAVHSCNITPASASAAAAAAAAVGQGRAAVSVHNVLEIQCRAVRTETSSSFVGD